MEFHALPDSIQIRVRTAHIYQRIMIHTILDNRWEADTVPVDSDEK